jgi:prepilin-type N-terminal cleavage/methylation domain-containing protein
MTHATHTISPLGARYAPRRGFTLIELMVALGILILLFALSSSALQKVRVSSNSNRTSEAISKLQNALNAELAQVNQRATNTDMNQPQYANLLQYCDNSFQRARALFTALEQRRYFPQTFLEAKTDAYIVSTGSGFDVRLGSYNPTTETPVYIHPHLKMFDTELSGLTAPAGANNESGVLLLIILNKRSTTGGGAMATAGDDLTSALKVQVPCGSASKDAYADGFKQAIGFNRWDNRAELQAAPYVDSKSPAKDPLDRQVLLSGWTKATSALTSATPAGLQFNNQNRTISLYSYGPDGKPDVAGGSSNDDILGFRMVQPGNKGF